ncbi:MAG: hypothetical protein AAGA75_00230 [Cyanobacteria bacterium P01_E01_bin.6]
MNSKYVRPTLLFIQIFVGLSISAVTSAVAIQPTIDSSLPSESNVEPHVQTNRAEMIAEGEGHHHEQHAEQEVPHSDSHGDSHGNAADHGGGHHHGSIDVSSASAIPSVQLIANDDPINGWNLHLVTENFAFAPEQVNGQSSMNEGHAHLYINGEKIMRIYSHWHHVPSLEPGMNTITVTLNANGHEEFINQGEIVGSTVMISVP